MIQLILSTLLVLLQIPLGAQPKKTMSKCSGDPKVRDFEAYPLGPGEYSLAPINGKCTLRLLWQDGTYDRSITISDQGRILLSDASSNSMVNQFNRMPITQIIVLLPTKPVPTKPPKFQVKSSRASIELNSGYSLVYDINNGQILWNESKLAPNTQIQSASPRQNILNNIDSIYEMELIPKTVWNRKRKGLSNQTSQGYTLPEQKQIYNELTEFAKRAKPEPIFTTVNSENEILIYPPSIKYESSYEPKVEVLLQKATPQGGTITCKLLSSDFYAGKWVKNGKTVKDRSSLPIADWVPQLDSNSRDQPDYGYYHLAMLKKNKCSKQPSWLNPKYLADTTLAVEKVK